ncbi:MAG: T9SS type A sorting domain-containing protein [Bacteroidales bacterium]|nr:T9SS type A sorting domain-containing protein [Bacteroidales bacterium]
MKNFTLLVCILFAGIIQAQTFTEVATQITPCFFASADFTDYDNDGDQDLAIFGVDANFNDIADIYRNDEGVFTPINAGIAPMHMGAISWADFDGDGDFDLLCSGQDYSMGAFAIIYENTDGVFTASSVDLPIGFWNSTGWGDYDGDGDLDLAYSWYTAGTANSAIFRNEGGSFANINADLPGLTAGSMEWGDYDGDGDLDLLHTGTPADFSNTLVLIYENNDGVFSDISAGFMDCAWYNNALWDDADGDGDLDVVYVGDDGDLYPFVVYFNTDGVFEMSNTGLFGVRTSNGNIGMQTGDIDNDGDMDVVMTGDNENYVKSTRIYLNDNGNYSALEHDIPGFGSGTVDLTDIDNDGDLDLFLVGYDNNSSGDVGIFINDANSNTYASNEAPSAPSNLFALVEEDGVHLTWDMATDDHTPQASLQYNIYIGSVSGLGDVVCAQSITDPLSAKFGFHFIPKQGNCEMQLQYNMSGLADGVYFWSVQAIDQSGAASVFASEQYFDIGNVTKIEVPDVNLRVYPNPASDLLNVSVPEGNSVRVEILTATGKPVIQKQLPGNSSQLDISGLEQGSYFVRIITGENKIVKKIQVIR